MPIMSKCLQTSMQLGNRNIGMGTALSRGPYWKSTVNLPSASTRRERSVCAMGSAGKNCTRGLSGRLASPLN